MVLQRPLTIVFCAVVFASGAASGEVVMKAVGDQVSFRPVEPLPSPLTSIIWKHRNNDNIVVKAIEWEDGDISILNPRFKGVTTVDEKTGEITITNLKHEHSGVYFMEINSKEQEQTFTLTVEEPVPQPEIKIERSSDPNRVYLNCEYRETIIWRNSDGETLPDSPIGKTVGKSITVEKALETNPENFYTCTLDNGASKKTSDPVYVKDLFEDGSQGSYLWLVILLVIVLVIIFVVFIVLYIYNEDFKKRVDDCCPCIGVFVAFCCSCIGKEKNPEETPGGKEKNSVETPADHMMTENETEANPGKEKNSVETPADHMMTENETETDPETVPLKKSENEECAKL